ncbi:MAG: hypothetical protein UZ03_NOB001001563 [Nitrospira sp. OLB3]|nr:MAG: hypothetical protein UZ03_NOB001001563 [Nitrospira sp. OLB3]
MAMYTLMRLPRSFAHRSVSLRFGWCVASILLVPIWGGCARMETVPDAKPSDLQVTVDQLKIAVRDAQRTAADLRAELDGQRQQLAEVELERARLQGMLRETERRLTEARQIIELQREELASARTERERMAHALRSLLPNRGRRRRERYRRRTVPTRSRFLERLRFRQGTPYGIFRVVIT